MKTFNRERAIRAVRIRWRKKNGLVIKVIIKPHTTGLCRASANFEGKIYIANGKDNSTALDNLFLKLKTLV